MRMYVIGSFFSGIGFNAFTARFPPHTPLINFTASIEGKDIINRIGQRSWIELGNWMRANDIDNYESCWNLQEPQGRPIVRSYVYNDHGRAPIPCREIYEQDGYLDRLR